MTHTFLKTRTELFRKAMKGNRIADALLVMSYDNDFFFDFECGFPEEGFHKVAERISGTFADILSLARGMERLSADAKRFPIESFSTVMRLIAVVEEAMNKKDPQKIIYAALQPLLMGSPYFPHFESAPETIATIIGTRSDAKKSIKTIDSIISTKNNGRLGSIIFEHACAVMTETDMMRKDTKPSMLERILDAFKTKRDTPSRHEAFDLSVNLVLGNENEMESHQDEIQQQAEHVDEHGWSPLSYAAAARNVSWAMRLVAAGNGFSPFACKGDFMSFVTDVWTSPAEIAAFESLLLKQKGGQARDNVANGRHRAV